MFHYCGLCHMELHCQSSFVFIMAIYKPKVVESKQETLGLEKVAGSSLRIHRVVFSSRCLSICWGKMK